MNLQDRYLFKELFRNFCFILGGLLFLFLLIDYALKPDGMLTIQYYASKLSSFATILLPVAFLLAALLVLADLNNKKQWIALQACKISRLRLLRPFFCFALILVAFLWINGEFLTQPVSYKSKRGSFFSASANKVHALRLKAGGFIFFQTYDKSGELLHDIYWLPSSDTLWHIQTLDINKSLATDAEKLVRDDKQRFVLSAHYKSITLPHFSFELPEEHDELLDAKEQPLSLLAKKATLFPQDDQEARATSYFLYKGLCPLLPLLLLFASAPSALLFRKNFSYFALFGFWITFYIILVALLDAAFFFGESHLVNPALAISLPLMLVLSMGGLSWSRST